MANRIDDTKITLGWQTGATDVVYATWPWEYKKTVDGKKVEVTDHYECEWQFTTGDHIRFNNNGNQTTTVKNTTWSVPSNAVMIFFRVKPVAKTYKSNNNDIPHYTAEFSKWVSISNKEGKKPATPSAPTVTINGYKLTAEIDTYDTATKYVEFQIIQNDRKEFGPGKILAKVVRNHAEISVEIETGREYKVRCRGYGDLVNNMTSTALPGEVGDWSEYSGNEGTIPSTPSIWAEKTRVLNPTTAQVYWHLVSNAESYTVEYTTNEGYFDSGPGMVQSITVPSTVNHAEVTGLESGQQWCFRVKATNSAGDSGWSAVIKKILGATPDAPTTWSESTTVIVGNPARLYWIHNCVDGSDQTAAQLEYTINGTTTTEDFTTGSSKSFDTSSYAEGAKLEWRVRTKGINGKWGPWSTMRTVTLYAPPTLTFSVSDPFTAYPLLLTMDAGPSTQTAVGFEVTITSNQTYEAFDNVGRSEMVRVGDVVYQNYFATSMNDLTVHLTPGDILLENGITYHVKITVAMDSGLSTTGEDDFYVSLGQTDYYPNASIGIDKERLCAYIQPFCLDADDEYPADVELSVYRREYDGKFTLVGEGVENNGSTTIIDPHPSLDYARYRVVSTNTQTGEIDYYDCPGEPVDDPSIVIQWSEEWTAFDPHGEESALAEPPWSGSMVKLPYNIDTQDNNSPDVSLVKYIGRENPVSYYGTQVGKTASWKCDIDAEDIETLYQLRRLAEWMGDVYVREPSGTGYWAQINVSFSYTHKEVVIPVSISVNKVEGGV